MSEPTELQGPDLSAGIDASLLKDDEPFVGHADGEPIVLVRHRGEICAVGARCSHYGGLLAEGIVEGGTVRCPWHHARFDLATGAAERPGRDPIPCYDVVREGGRIRVAGRRASPAPAEAAARRSRVGSGPASVVVVGAGAAGNACAEELRRLGYGGPITLLGAEGTVPPDRPNLSKDYLAGTAPEEWVPLRGAEFYAENGIDLRAEAPVLTLDPARREVRLADGSSLPYGVLLLATGAEPIRLGIPGAERAVTLRSLADAKRIAQAAVAGRRAVVLGASFLGLEVAASLRARSVEVDVVGPETRPLERVLGPELGDLVRSVHEERGVRFHLGRRPSRIDAETVTLDDGGVLRADLVAMCVGVRPRVDLAGKAGIALDRGVLVDARLRTSTEGVWAAGDIARYPDERSGAPIRVEHWVVAERQGQHAARAILGDPSPYRAVPFFWSQHHDLTIGYVGHAESWDAIEIAGDLRKRSALVAYRRAGRVLAVASVSRERESLLVEAAMERGDETTLERCLRA